MLILGLTGSIGMGKSTAAKHLRARRIPVLDADAEVHRLYAGPLADRIEAAFPGSTTDGVVDRAKLSALVLTTPGAVAQLEAIVHPAVRAAEKSFLHAAARMGFNVAVLEVPLLFETGADRLCDATMVVSTDPATQRARILARPGMTEAKLAAILARQLPDSEKRARADFVVDTSGPIADTEAQIDDILARLPGWPAEAFASAWT
jgi:dephospho-CoA kinase